MFRCPEVGLVGVPSMATTCLPSASPRVSKVGPGPSDTYGTVTTASSTPNTTIGTERHHQRQNPPVHAARVDPAGGAQRPGEQIRAGRSDLGNRRRARSLTADHRSTAARPQVGTVEGMPDLPFGFSAGDDPIPTSRRRTASPAPATRSGSAPAASTRPTWARSSPSWARCSAGRSSAMSGGSSGRSTTTWPASWRPAPSGSPHRCRRAPSPRSPTPCTWPTPGWTAPPHCRPAPSGRSWTPHRLGGRHPGDLEKRLCDPMAEQISNVGPRRCRGGPETMAGPLMAINDPWAAWVRLTSWSQTLGRLSSADLHRHRAAAQAQGRPGAAAGAIEGRRSEGLGNRQQI